MEQNAGYYLTLAEVELKAENYDKALGYMEAGRNLDSSFIDWDMYEIYIWNVQEDYYKVCELCSAYYDRDSNNLKILEIWQEACEKLEWYKDVVGIGFAAIDLHTQDPAVYERIANAYQIYGQYRDAISVLEPVVEQFPEFNNNLQELYYILATTDGHFGIEEGRKSIEYGDKYRKQFDFDWRLEYRDITMRMCMSDNDGAIRVAEDALSSLKNIDYEQEEDMPMPELLFKWLKGKAMFFNRKDKFKVPFEHEQLEKSYEYLKQIYKEAWDKKDMDIIGCCLENLNTYWTYTGAYDDAIAYLNEAINGLSDTEYDLSEFNEMLSRIYVLKKDIKTSREYKLKALKSFDLGSFTDEITGLIVTADNLAELKIINISAEVERVENVMNAFVEMPEIFTEEEIQNNIDKLLTFIEKVIELNREDLDVMIPLVGHAIYFGPALTTDYQRLYKIINSKFMKKLYSNATQKYHEKFNQNLMRICYFLGNENESKAYAKAYMNDLNEKAYCRDKEMTLENACKEARYSNRIDISAVGTAFLYMGRIEDAKAMLVLMMMNPACYFCKLKGCLEYYLLKAEIDVFEGKYDEAREFLNEVNKTEWNNHEEMATAMLKYLDSKTISKI